MTIDGLAAVLQVSRRTIERAIDAELIVPTHRTASGRARFSAEYVEALRARAEQARGAGAKYVVCQIADKPPRLKLTTHQWVRQALWKRRNLRQPAKYPSKT